MIRTLAAVALLAASHAAAADPVPRLKELVTVTAEVVRIGDLVENAGAVADIPVFRAPDLGQTGAVQVARVTEALRPHDMGGLDTAGLTEVVVTRLSRAITSRDIADRIARAFAGQFGFGEAERLAVILDRDIRVLHVEASATADLSVTRMNLDQRTGRFDVWLELPDSATARRLPMRFTGSVTETLETATLARALRMGEIVKASDVVMARRPKAEIGGEAMAAEQVVGLAAKAPLRGGQTLRSGDLTKPQVVQRNEPVTLMYEVPGIVLTARGKALEAGAVGDMIGVLNVQSNRTIQATVTAPGRVTVAATGSAMFAAAAGPAPETNPATRRTQ